MNQSLNYKDFNLICRICLFQRENMMSIKTSQIVTMLEDCTTVDDQLYEKLPQQICNHCYWQLKNVYTFKQQCLVSLEILCELVILHENEDDLLQKNLIPHTFEGEKLSSTNLNIKSEENFVSEESKTDIIDPSQNLILEEFQTEEFRDEYEDIDLNSEESSSGDNKEIIENLEENECQQKSLADILRKKFNIYGLTCNICNKELSTRATLVRHMDIHNKNRILKFRCNICNKGFYAAENLRKHEKRHMGQTKYQCDQCPKRFYVLSTLGIHYKTRHKAEPIKCTECPAEFYHSLQLTKHEKITHSKREYVCDACGKTFSLKYYLREHQITHSEERQHKCDYCKKGFKHRGTLKAHLKLVHIDPERREMCNVCGKLILPSTLRSHLESHDKETVYKCPDCGKIYNNKYVLRSHINEKHSPDSTSSKAVCNVCNKHLRSKRTLKTHMTVMHSDIKKRECHICGKAYKLQCNVNAHIQSAHMDVRPHVCGTCNKAFHTKTLLSNHMRTHTGERPFACTICGKSFGFKGVLTTHMKVHAK